MDTRQLQQSMLFRGMTELEITKALQVLEAHEKSFQKGETLLIAGTITERMGLVLEGSVTIESNDAWGQPHDHQSRRTGSGIRGDLRAAGK